MRSRELIRLISFELWNSGTDPKFERPTRLELRTAWWRRPLRLRRRHQKNSAAELKPRLVDHERVRAELNGSEFDRRAQNEVTG